MRRTFAFLSLVAACSSDVETVNVPPDTAVGSAPSCKGVTQATANGNTVSVTWTAATDDKTAVNQITYQVFVDSTSVLTTPPGTTTATLSNVADGSHVISVSAVDGDGNVSKCTDTQTVVVGSTPDASVPDSLPDSTPDAVQDSPSSCTVPTDAIFVATSGSAEVDCGTATKPCSTIAKGLGAAKEKSKKLVVVAGGVYEEDAVDALANATVQGGYTVASGAWSRSCDDSAADLVLIRPKKRNITIMAKDIGGTATFDTLTVKSKVATAGESLYGVFAQGNTTKLQLNNIKIEVSDGGNGAAGTKGIDGNPAADPNTTTCTDDVGLNGTNGSNGAGAAEGVFGDNGYMPTLGSNGTPGTSGKNGKVGSVNSASCYGCSWKIFPSQGCNTPSTGSYTTVSSTAGKAGCGGGGGAGGGGGGGGGSSIGIFASGATVDVLSGRVEVGKGGNGGAGSSGGIGALGTVGLDGYANYCSKVNDGCVASGGPGCTGFCIIGCYPKTENLITLSAGSKGGTGGTGGVGGSGGGGSGGHAFVIVERANGKVSLGSSTTTNYGTGGSGGSGADVGAKGKNGLRAP